MMGYTDTTTRKTRFCAWCGDEIPKGWPAKRWNFMKRLIFHASCAHLRENHFKRQLAQH